MRCPEIYMADDLRNRHLQADVKLPDGRWVAARPLPFALIGKRWHAAWLVLIGRADAVRWIEQ